MNLFFRDEVVFAAEYQNEPLDVRFDESLTIDEIASRANGYERGIVPTSCETLTGFIDVQQNLLYWCVCAWQKNFTGYVIDYGAWPDQRALNFRYSQAKNTIAKRFPGLSIEAGLRKSLDELITELTARTFKRDDGTEMQVNRLLVDGQWQTDIVYAACRENPSSANLYPARGKFVGATTDPLNERQKRAPGKTIGVHWRIEKSNRGPIRQVLADSNYWKSFVHSRLATDPAERGSLTLYMASSKHHKTFAAHMKSEYSVRAEGRGRVVDEWKLRADRPDNHWLDCLSGCAIAASIEGCTLAELGSNSPAVKKVRKHRDRDERVAYL